MPGPPSDDAGPGLLESGEPCTVDAQCASGICLPADRGAVCTGRCTSLDDCLLAVSFEAACAPVSRGDRIETLCIPYRRGGHLLGQSCDADRDCAASTCVEGQCREACADDRDCLPGQLCRVLSWGDGSFFGCGYGSDSGVVAIDLGERPLRGGRTIASVTIATPPDALSVTLIAHVTGGDPLPLTFVEVTDPRGTPIFSLSDVTALRDPPVRWIPIETFDAITMLVPNATPDRLPYTNGRYTFQISALERTSGDAGVATVRIEALVQRAPGGTVRPGTLDLDVFLVGVGLTADSAPKDPRMRTALDRYRSVLARAGITVGEVSYFDVSGADATRYQVVDSIEGPDSELAGLFRLSAGRSDRRLNLFLVRSIRGREGFAALGISGGIPGPTGVHGTGHSGVVVAFDPAVIGSDGALAGHVMAHETGHFLGLFHVTERLRPCDPAEMPPGCSPWGGTDTIDDTTHGDDTNLMHWAVVGAGTNDRLTPGQAYVLLRSALLR